MGQVVNAYGLALQDVFDPAATTFLVHNLDRLDITAYNNDARLQFLVFGAWTPDPGLLLRKGIFRSIPGLSILYPPGAEGFRVRNNQAGFVSLVDYEAFSL